MDADLIWIEEAHQQYDRSRSWLDNQIDAGALTMVKIPGDRRVYLRRSELDALLRPRDIRRGDSGTAAG